MQAYGVTTSKKALLYVVSLIALSTAVHAQEITGTWQATLPIDRNPRIILKISKADDGSLRASFNRPDIGAGSIAFPAVTFVAPNLNIPDFVGFNYQGKLGPDGKSITGTWTQDKHSYPLTFALGTPDTLWTSAGPALMSATADPTFEVATIKPSSPDPKQRSSSPFARQFHMNNQTITQLIEFAWQVQARQIEGGPSWKDELRFDIAAEPDAPGQPNRAQVRSMLKKLLAERFGLQIHTLQKEFPVYALSIVRNPPNITKSELDPANWPSIRPQQDPDGQWRVRYSYATMPEFASLLMSWIKDRQIVDQTGLSGPFEITLMFPADTLGSPTTSELGIANAIFPAVQQIGLKLRPTNAPVDVIVIDHLDKPSPN
jgi:uncharacterized protein (TIGR03435 family)